MTSAVAAEMSFSREKRASLRNFCTLLKEKVALLITKYSYKNIIQIFQNIL